MAVWSDNIRIFDSAVACGILSKEDASDLKSAYISIRNEAHRQSLRGSRGLSRTACLCRSAPGNRPLAEDPGIGALCG